MSKIKTGPTKLFVEKDERGYYPNSYLKWDRPVNPAELSEEELEEILSGRIRTCDDRYGEFRANSLRALLVKYGNEPTDLLHIRDRLESPRFREPLGSKQFMLAEVRTEGALYRVYFVHWKCQLWKMEVSPR